MIFLRGGGSGLEVFDNIELCKTAIGLTIPFITGIGHDADKTLLQKISDRGFSTPTSVGVFLQKIINIHKKRIKAISLMDLEMKQYIKQVENEKQELNYQIIKHKKTSKITLIIIVVVLFILGIMFLF